ncbi:MAG: cache domain-containing protein [Treponema sp.]|nr:cache domain-containing protein [Treponema sp.]
MAKKALDRFDTKARRNLLLRYQIMGMMAIFIVISTSVATAISLEVFDYRSKENTQTDILHTADGVSYIIEDWQDNIIRYANILSKNSEAEKIILDYDSDFANDYITEISDEYGIDLLAYVNSSGNIINAFGAKSGENVSSSYLIKKSIRGSSVYGFDAFGDIKFGIIASSPVYSDGNVIGCVVCAYELVDMEEGSFIDIVRKNYNVETTVFQGNIRVATTLGQKLVGTELANKEIVKEVLTDGKEYRGPNIINKIKYYTNYRPLKNDDGTNVGMLFVAKSMQSIEQVRNQAMQVVLPVVIALIILFNIICYLYVRYLMNRILVVTNFLKDLEKGDADLTKRANLYRRDEIGDLVVHFDFFLDKLQQIIKDVKASKDVLSNSGSALSSSIEDTSSSITEIIANIDSIHGQIGNQTEGVRKSSSAVNEISEGIVKLDSMIEEQSAGVAQASAAIEEMIGNISSVNSSVEKMSSSFRLLDSNAQESFKKQQEVGEKVKQMEEQSKMLKDANSAISSIASQTNLLAMNAAIEAAHAGEAGQGFSVVADEMRKLAETSSQQSSKIGKELKSIKKNIGSVVEDCAESEKSFHSVEERIGTTGDLVSHIRAAMEEQQSGSQQILNALQMMNDSTSEVRTSGQQMNERGESIMNDVDDLKESMDKIQSAISELSSGTDYVTATTKKLNEISDTFTEALKKINNNLNRFKV